MDDTIRRTLAASRRPPEPPLDEMWRQIESRVFGDVRSDLVLRPRVSHWRLPALAAAAALTVGVGLGWYAAPRNVVTQIVASPVTKTATVRSTASTDTEPVHAEPAGTVASATPPEVTAPHAVRTGTVQNYPEDAGARLASRFNDVGGGSDMRRYLAQTAVLLASLPSDRAAAGSDTAFAAHAGELLTQTHLLLDSQAGSDPTLHRLLEDLELVLAQVARLNGTRNAGDLQLIHQALTSHDVLPRVHDASIEASITD